MCRTNEAVPAKTRQESGRIIFTYGNNMVVVPLDVYEPGAIKETREKLSKQLNCRPEDIQIKITDIRDGGVCKGSSLKGTLVDTKAIRNFIK
jgi:hypothetical protein